VGAIGWDPEYESAMDFGRNALHASGMIKRLASMLLWFYAGWALGSLFAFTTGGSELIGPVLGAAAAAIFAGDPRRIIWSTRNRA
jgi:hypothetical protein